MGTPQKDGSVTVPRPRAFPEGSLPVAEALVGFLQFVQTTAVNKVAGLTEQEARIAPVPTSPALSPLGLIKHLTAVLRQHIQIHIAGSDLPPLWRTDDHDFEFRIGPNDTVASVIAAFDEECARSRQTLATVDLEADILTYGSPNRVGRLVVDVLQESARHLGHLDIVRELIDGSKGE